MSLLTPDSGLLFWMLLSFGIVLVILSKFGFPVIVKAIEERKAYIDHSIESARQAEAQLAHIQAECAQRLEEAKAQQNVILREAYAEKERILEAVRQEATHEGQKLIEEATRRIREEKAQAIREMRGELADLSLSIAEKIMRQNLGRGTAQEEAINRLLDEATISKS